MNSTDCLAPNAGELVSKTFDDEVIIINLVTGAYYSTTGSGALVWRAIEERKTEEQIAQLLSAAYEVTEDTAREDVARLLGELREENLVLTVAAAGPRAVAPPEPADPRRPYDVPAISAYRDMRDLLALDPPMPVLGDPPPDWDVDRER